MKRRDLLATIAAMTLAGRASASLTRTTDLADSARSVWRAWKEVHLSPDGRVVDVLQQEASHSEGQGYGMVLATEFGDRDAFERMFGWAETNLARRADGLLSWRWLPHLSDQVPDLNNASDGDLFYGWALLRAGRAWDDAGYMRRATAIARALVETCIVRDPSNSDRLLFLPAAAGFVHDGTVTVNPSYYMPLAMRELADAAGADSLGRCAGDGEDLLARVAGNGLVPDWIEVSPDGWAPSARLDSNTGYEALRVPLFLVWSGAAMHPAVLQAARVYDRTVRPGQPVPTVMEPISGVVLETSPDDGYRALAGLVRCARDGGPGAEIPPFNPHQPYYPATLQLLAMLAANKVLPECVPI